MGKNRHKKRAEKMARKGICAELKLSPLRILIIDKIIKLYMQRYDTLMNYDKKFNDLNDYYTDIKEGDLMEIADVFERAARFLRAQEKVITNIQQQPIQPQQVDVPLEAVQ